MTIKIDPGAGFCFGVQMAIKKAEESLKNGDEVYCLGEIVHNQEEIKRLEGLGLTFIDYDQLNDLSNKKVLIRAHGEPPQTYEIAKKNNLEIIEATCPIVLKLQEKIRKASAENPEAQIVIFGKNTHAEVIGLAGQIPEQSIIINSVEEIDKINFKKPVRLFSQTTKSLKEFRDLIKLIKEKAEKENTDFAYFDTVCRKVSNRKSEVEQFAKQNDLIIFISGKNSSNGNYLYSISKKTNPNSYFISSVEDIKNEWFNGIDKIGISAATSTPQWLINDIKEAIEFMGNS